MSRTILWIVTVFLTLAMAAMVSVQAYWIRRSVNAEEQQLGMVVNQVLSEISDELVRNETLIAILDEIRPPVVQSQSQAVWNFHIDDRSAYNRTDTVEINKEDENVYVDRVDMRIEYEEVLIPVIEIEPEESELWSESEKNEPEKVEIVAEFVDPEVGPDVEEEEPEEQAHYIYTPPDHSLKNQKVKLINDSLLVILGEDEHLQDTILVNAINPEQIRIKLEEEVQDHESFVDRIVKSMLVDEEQVIHKFSSAQMEALLTKKLHERGVDMPFEYAVYEEGKKPIHQSEDFNEYEECNYFRTSLFPGNVFSRSTYISVYFPNEREHFRKSMGIMGGSSLLITLFILTMFSLTLYIIFKQKRLSEMKNDFVNNMTHELKTPISTISLASQMLNDRTIPDEQKNLGQISRIIQAESKQLGFQVERVLQMAIFDHGELKLKSEEVDLHDVIETVAQNVLLQLDRRNGKLEFLPEAETALVQGDLMHLTNVISNLLENAMKYTSRTPEISVATKNVDGQVVLSVSDNGIGISKENQKRIFDKFYRVPTGNVHNVKGFGLGLSYVKLIVEQHGGTINLKSELNKGSQFHIHLPLPEQNSPNV
jgi:two-component system phosphate regulon sensor histidine kinase PhoR